MAKHIKTHANFWKHTKIMHGWAKKFAKSKVGKAVIAAVVIYFTWGMASGYFAAAEGAAAAIVPAAEAGTRFTVAASGSAGVGAGVAAEAAVVGGVEAAAAGAGAMDIASIGGEISGEIAAGATGASEGLVSTAMNAAP